MKKSSLAQLALAIFGAIFLILGGIYDNLYYIIGSWIFLTGFLVLMGVQEIVEESKKENKEKDV